MLNIFYVQNSNYMDIFFTVQGNNENLPITKKIKLFVNSENNVNTEVKSFDVIFNFFSYEPFSGISTMRAEVFIGREFFENGVVSLISVGGVEIEIDPIEIDGVKVDEGNFEDHLTENIIETIFENGIVFPLLRDEHSLTIEFKKDGKTLEVQSFISNSTHAYTVNKNIHIPTNGFLQGKWCNRINVVGSLYYKNDEEQSVSLTRPYEVFLTIEEPYVGNELTRYFFEQNKKVNDNDIYNYTYYWRYN